MVPLHMRLRIDAVGNPAPGACTDSILLIVKYLKLHGFSCGMKQKYYIHFNQVTMPKNLYTVHTQDNTKAC